MVGRHLAERGLRDLDGEQAARAWKPGWHTELDEAIANQTALGLDALRVDAAGAPKADTPAEINELFDAIAYKRAPRCCA